MTKVPRVNVYECAGCALCTFALPEVFRMTPEGKSEVFAPDKASKVEIQEVMDDCPVGAVHWFDDGK
jgi:ferredoxin